MATIKQVIEHYKNDDLCQKWSNNIPADELDYLEDYSELSQDIDSVCSMFSFLPADDITGIKSSQRDGDYTEIYVTESSRPYSLDAIYHPLEYYL